MHIRDFLHNNAVSEAATFQYQTWSYAACVYRDGGSCLYFNTMERQGSVLQSIKLGRGTAKE